MKKLATCIVIAMAMLASLFALQPSTADAHHERCEVVRVPRGVITTPDGRRQTIYRSKLVCTPLPHYSYLTSALGAFASGAGVVGCLELAALTKTQACVLPSSAGFAASFGSALETGVNQRESNSQANVGYATGFLATQQAQQNLASRPDPYIPKCPATFGFC